MPVTSSDLPGSDAGPNQPGPLAKANGSPLFGLSPSGVCPASLVTQAAVRSYRTFSPLPARTDLETRPAPTWRFVFCGTVPILADGGRYPPLRSAEPGLSSRESKLTRGRLIHSGQTHPTTPPPLSPVAVLRCLFRCAGQQCAPARDAHWRATPARRASDSVRPENTAEPESTIRRAPGTT